MKGDKYLISDNERDFAKLPRSKKEKRARKCKKWLNKRNKRIKIITA